MGTTKIIELFIDDELDQGGIEAISLVSKPAHEEDWHAFKSQGCSCGQNFEVEELNPYQVIADDFCDHNQDLFEKGEDYEDLINDGWDIVKVERITPTVVHTMQSQKFSNPNAESQLDTENIRVRYKYVGPISSNSRAFCRQMISRNKVYRIEDIENLSNPEFGNYNIFLYRGSFNCKHAWVRLIYKQQGNIRNSGSSSKGVIDQEVVVAADTRNKGTIAVGETGLYAPRDVKNPRKATQRQREKDRDPRDGSQFIPKYNREPFSEDYFEGLEDACWEGYEPIGLKEKDGKMVPNCVPIKEAMAMEKEEFKTYNDYPESAKNNACKALRWRDEHGDEVKGMTQVGWIRANQLCKGENISEETISRMSGFQRHKTNSEVSPEFKDTPWKDRGYVAWLGWGGTTGIEWASNKLETIKNQKMTFAYDEDKKILIGAAMVPNRMIHRYDELGNLYYVYFSKESIAKMAKKFLKEQRTDDTSIEHNGIKLGKDKVFISESWISEDPIYDKSHKYGFSLPEGTWFVSMKVNDDKVWKLIKSKTLNGFSVEGLFAEKSVFSKEDKQINQITKILKSIKDD